MNDYRREAINSSRAAARACTRARRGTSTLSRGRPQGRAPTIYELVHLFNIFVLSMREHLRFLTFTLRFAQPTNIVEDDAHSCIVGTGQPRPGDDEGAPVLVPLRRHWGGALLLALVFLLFPLQASAHAATNTGRIYGQLLDGTKRNAPVAGQSVTLQMAQGENASDLTSTTTDAHGMFSFSNLNTDKTINYAIYTLYQGSQYYTDLIDLSTRPVQKINLTVYDATTSIANIAIVQANILIDKADAQSNLITISENYIFENLGLTTYVGSLQAHGSKPNALLFSLPKNARNVSLKSGFDGYQIIQVNSGFATNASVSPGLSQFAFSFQVPFTTSNYDFGYTVVYPTVNLTLLVPLNIHASSAALDSQGPVNANQQTFQQFNAKKLLADAQFHVQLDGLPVSQQAASPQSLNPNTRWIILAILLMLAIVGVTWLVYQLSRRQATKRQKQTSQASRGGRNAITAKRGSVDRQSSNDDSSITKRSARGIAARIASSG